MGLDYQEKQREMITYAGGPPLQLRSMPHHQKVMYGIVIFLSVITVFNELKPVSIPPVVPIAAPIPTVPQDPTIVALTPDKIDQLTNLYKQQALEIKGRETCIINSVEQMRKTLYTDQITALMDKTMAFCSDKDSSAVPFNQPVDRSHPN